MDEERLARPRWSGRSARAGLVIAPLAALLLPLGQPVLAAGTGQRCVAGASGVGDPYLPAAGNGGYDVAHYDLSTRYDPATDVLQGTTQIRARAQERLCSFDLDLVGLDVRSVEVDGRAAHWVRAGDELVVTPRRPLPKGSFSVAVTYDGVPGSSPDGFGFLHTEDGAFAAGQPEGAAYWYPVNDHPTDKASYAFHVSVPPGYVAVANGLPTGERRGADGWTTYDWDAREPMVSYASTVAIDAWEVRTWRSRGVQGLDAVDPDIEGELRAAVDESLSRQPRMLEFFGQAFGRYPFSAAGAIVDNAPELWFGLETQTRSIYSSNYWLDLEGDISVAAGDSTVAHETAHQWMGDSVSIERWADIWLNEGWATYAEWMWADANDQEWVFTPFVAATGTVAELARAAYDTFPPDHIFWNYTIGDPGLANMFRLATYFRGAMTLQVVRETVGETAFARISRQWHQRNEGGNVTTDDFIALAERVSGLQLDELFHTWLFTTGKPPLDPLVGATAAQPQTRVAPTDAAGVEVASRARHRG